MNKAVTTTNSGVAAPSPDDRFFYTILLDAMVHEGHSSADLVQLLLQSGAKAKPAHIFLAINMLDAAMTKVLIEYGADPNWRDPIHGFTALHMAIYYGALAIIEVLLQAGADLAIINVNNHTPMECTPKDKADFLNVIELVTQRKKTNAEDAFHYWHSLVRALAFDSITTVRMLLKAGTPVTNSIVSKDGLTLLEFAVARNHQATIDLLTEYYDNWTKSLKADIQEKYRVLKLLQQVVLNREWDNKKVIFSSFGITLFARSSPDGIERIRLSLSRIPVILDVNDIKYAWPLIEKSYAECHTILLAKQRPYIGKGERIPITKQFYSELLALYSDPARTDSNKDGYKKDTRTGGVNNMIP